MVSDEALDRARAFCRERRAAGGGAGAQEALASDGLDVKRWIERSKQRGEELCSSNYLLASPRSHPRIPPTTAEGGSTTYTKLKGVKAQLKLADAGVAKASSGSSGTVVVSAWNSGSEPKANASSDLTHGSSEVLAGNVARGLRRRRAREKKEADSSSAEIARALLEEKKKAWEMQNLGGGGGGSGGGIGAQSRMVIEGLDRLSKVGAGTSSAEAGGRSTRQSSARTSVDDDSCRASSASFVTPRDVLNSRGSVSEEIALGRRCVGRGVGERWGGVREKGEREIEIITLTTPPSPFSSPPPPPISTAPRRACRREGFESSSALYVAKAGIAMGKHLPTRPSFDSERALARQRAQPRQRKHQERETTTPRALALLR